MSRNTERAGNSSGLQNEGRMKDFEAIPKLDAAEQEKPPREEQRTPLVSWASENCLDSVAGKERICRTKVSVILTGTDPTVVKGGIATAVAGYQAALARRGILGCLLPTFKAGSFTGKWWPWLQAVIRLPKIVHAEKKNGKFVVVYGHAGPAVSLLRESLILALARTLGAKTMLQLHAPRVERYLERPLGRFGLKLAFIPVTTVTVLAPWWNRRMAADGFPGTVVIPNPMPPELEQVAEKKWHELTNRAIVRVPGKALMILSMARLEKNKGVDLAIRALQYLPENMCLHVAGDGRLRSELEALTQTLGLAHRVHFEGWVSGKVKARLLEQADIFCLPSRADSFGMVFIEAMAYGKPVVTIDARANADVVQHKRTGLVVDRRTPEGISQAIKYLEDPDVRFRMGKAAAGWVLNSFSAEVVGRRIEAAVCAIAEEA